METLRVGSRGPWVEFLQSVLKRAGYFTGVVDGIFGEITRASVTEFQRSSGLLADGIVGVSSWRSLQPFINGYDYHRINFGDTLFLIARRYSTTVDRILTANPGIDPYNILVGQRIIIPSGEVVPTDVSYFHEILTMNIESLKMLYPFLEVGRIGNSGLCKGIHYFRMGTGPKEVFYNGSFHANEWITSVLLMKFAENYLRAYTDGSSIYGVDVRTLFREVSIYVVPMVNPDGVDLVTGAMATDTTSYALAAQIAAGFPNIPFPSGWKANISGVDTNLQFPANWERAKEIKFAQGFDRPAPRDYVGPSPLSAPESSAVYDFTRTHDFRLTLSYHTQGRVIFWQYLDYLPSESYAIGRELSNSSGYALEQTPYASSFAGYKDWFIQEYNRPGYTIEAGIGVNPLPIAQFDTIYRDNEGVLVLAAVLAP